MPDQPGIYKFLQGRKILYIGKATSLKDRVRSYFTGDVGEARGPKIVQMLALANKVEWQNTDSVLEALILESALIKKHQPPYNSREKDDKSYTHVVITKEKFPRVLSIRGKQLKDPYFAKPARPADGFNSAKVGKIVVKYQFGPFPYAGEIKEALKILRKIFPYRDKCVPCEQIGNSKTGKCRPCFNCQIGLCPGVCTGEISGINYNKNIRHIKLFFSGKKRQIINNLEKEMAALAKIHKFEKAAKLRDQIFSLNHIQDVSLLKYRIQDSVRIEAYDIAHLSGRQTVGAMAVWQDGEINRSESRKFMIKGQGRDKINDIQNMKEILERRRAHDDWPRPDIIVVDGNQNQLNTAQAVFNFDRTVSIVAVTKDEKHRAHKVLGDSQLIRDHYQAIISANAAAHQLALSYHQKKMREKMKS